MNAPRPVSISVLDNYLQGNYHLHRVGRGAVDEEQQKAAEYFQRAIDKDPNFRSCVHRFSLRSRPNSQGGRADESFAARL